VGIRVIISFLGIQGTQEGGKHQKLHQKKNFFRALPKSLFGAVIIDGWVPSSIDAIEPFAL